ncbi:eukaryotic translation initiation factor 4 gamma 1-like isoform X2 [Ischnura elegans]|uniref:eukaryotic translation initiation factor 4 gamma 1-like isoform X2 n=1 Tax=Ischnura elegans TaxID=197161 RepID=UPI001ED86CB4|nr:eukaryotic translation initiation factor 4 gamma 1-like isoform X2 [Ischnura elegans]
MVSRTKEPVHCFVQPCAPTHHQHHGHHQHHHQAHPPPHLGHPPHHAAAAAAPHSAATHHPHHPHPHHHHHHQQHHHQHPGAAAAAAAHPHHHHQASPPALPPLPPPQQAPQNPQGPQQGQQQQAPQQPPLGPFRIVATARPDVWATGFSAHQGGTLRNIPPSNLPPQHHTSAIGGLGPGGGAGPQGGGGGGGGGGGPAQAPTPPGTTSHDMAKQGGGPPTPQSSHMAAQPHMPASGMHMGFSMSNQQRPSGPQSYNYRANNAARLVSSRNQVMTPNGVGHLGYPHIPSYSAGLPVVAAPPMNSQATLYLANSWPYPPGTPPRQPGGYPIHAAAPQQMLFQQPLYPYPASPQPNQGQFYIQSQLLRSNAGGASGGGAGGTPPQQPPLQQQSPVAPMGAQQVGAGGGGGMGVGSGGGGGPPPTVGLVSNVMGHTGVVPVGPGGVGGPSTQQPGQPKPRRHAVQIVHPDTGHDVIKKMLADEATAAGSSGSEATTQEESMKRKKEFTAQVRKVAKSPSATPPPQPQPPDTSSAETIPPTSGAMNGPSENLYSIPSESVGPSPIGMNVASEPWKQNPDKERDHMVEPCEDLSSKAVPVESMTEIESMVHEKEKDGANVVVPSEVVPEVQQPLPTPQPPPTPVVSARGPCVRVPSPPVAPSVALPSKPPSALTHSQVVGPPASIPAGLDAPVASMAKEVIKESVVVVSTEVPPFKPKASSSQKVPPFTTSISMGIEQSNTGKMVPSASREGSSERKKSNAEVAPKEEEKVEERLSVEPLPAVAPMEEMQPPLPQRQPPPVANGDDGADSKATQKSKQKKVQKNRDLNRKGAEKEGTDMDAFSDARQQQGVSAEATAAAPSANSDAPLVSQRIEGPMAPADPPQAASEKVVNEVKSRTVSPPGRASPSDSPVVTKAEKAIGATPLKGAVNNVDSAVLPTLVNSTSSSLSSSTSSLKSEPQSTRVPSSKPGAEIKNWEVKTAAVDKLVASEVNSVGSPVEQASEPEKEVAVEKPTEEDSVAVSELKQDDADRSNEDSKLGRDISSTEKSDRQDDIVAAKNSENALVSSLPAVDTNKKQEEESLSKMVNSTPVSEPAPPSLPPVIETTVVENKLKLKEGSKDDQWSPQNPQGKKKYERDFLLKIRDDPQSMKKPDNLPDIDIVLKDSTNRQAQFMLRPVDVKSITNISRSSPQDFAPGFVRSGHPSKQMALKRSSQQGKKKIIHVSLSLNEDPKLHEAENAWKPRYKIKEPTKKDDEVVDPDELYSAMRGILNKLTPQNFDKLVLQVLKLPINTMEKLKGVIDLVFDKAVDEPNFSVAYAELCHYLNSKNIGRQAQKSSEESNSDFRAILLRRCQTEFEKDKATGRGLTEKQKEIDKETSEEKRKELRLQVEEDERRMRRKSVGVTRFIGELYKLGMISHSIMVTCIKELLVTRDEESLECLCKLLTTVGKVLEEALEKKPNAKPPNLNEFFNKMKAIVQERKVSSRVRFMLQDAIDLKNSKWVPRRDESNPKKISQIVQDAERESMEQSQLAASYVPSRGSMGGGSNRKEEKRKPVDGWSMVPSKKGITVDAGKLRVETDVGLLGPNNKSKWSEGASGGQMGMRPERAKLSYQILADLEGGSLGGERYKDKIPRYKESSQSYTKSGSTSYINSEEERSRVAPMRKNAGGASQSSMDGSRLRGGPPPKTPSRDSSVVPDESSRSGPASNASADAPKASVSLSPAKLERLYSMILDEYFSDPNCKEAYECIKEKLPPVHYMDFLEKSIEKVLEQTPAVRASFGKLIIYLIKEKLIMEKSFVDALNKILEIAEDMILDVPKFWDYIAEILVVLLEEEVLAMSVLRDLTSQLQQNKLSGLLVLAVLTLLFKNKGHAWISDKWKASSLQWKDLMSPSEVDSFVKDHGLEYVMGGSGSIVFSNSSKLPIDKVKEKLDEFLRSKGTTNDLIFGWIDGNVGKGVNEPAFIRALTTSVLENCIENEKLNEKAFSTHYVLLQKYLAADDEKELACLFAIQALITKMEHPKGLLLNIFDQLSDNDVIQHDTFKAWEKSTLEPDGKAVALRSLTQFFTFLNETEDDSNED